MKGTHAFILAIASLIAAPAAAKDAVPVQTIIVDNTQVCGNARLSYHVQEDAKKQAYRLASQIEREKGIKTRVIVFGPGQYLGNLNGPAGAPAPVYLASGC